MVEYALHPRLIVVCHDIIFLRSMLSIYIERLPDNFMAAKMVQAILDETKPLILMV